MSQLSQASNRCQEKDSLIELPTCKMTPGWTSRPKIFGTAVRGALFRHKSVQLSCPLKLQDNNCSLLQKTRAREEESLREENLGSGAWLIYLPGILYKRRLGPICHNCVQETSEPHLHQAVTTIQHYDELHPMQVRLLADEFHSGVPAGDQIFISPTGQGAEPC